MASVLVRCFCLFAVLASLAVPLRAAEPRRVSGVILEKDHPVAARLYIEGPPGTFHFAHSAAAQGTAVVYDVKRSETCREQHVTLSAHPFEVDLLPGEYTFTVERGHEYFATKQLVTVPASGAVPPVELKLERWINMADRGWYSGDTHLHRKLDDVPNLVAAEDLHVALPLTYWVRGAYERPVEFPVNGNPEPKLITIEESRAGRTPLQRFIWPINTEYELFTVNGKSHTQGAVLVLNHKTPLRPGAPPVGPLTQAAREEGALFDLDKHTWNWTPMIVPVMGADLFELANNHVWRTEFHNKSWTTDVLPKDWEIETDPQGYTERGWIDWGFKTYYAYLNCGFRMRPTGGTGSGFHPVPAGFGRVYVNCPDGFSYEKWMEGLNAGRSFVSTGPMLEVTFNGQPPGSIIQAKGPVNLKVRGRSFSATYNRTVAELIVNGEVVTSLESGSRTGSGNEGLPLPDTTKFPKEIHTLGFSRQLTRSSWVAVRLFEYRDVESVTKDNRERSEPLKTERFRYAHTAPVYIEIDGPIQPRNREVNYFIHRMEQEIARHTGVLADDEVAEYRKALEVYQEIAKRAVE